MYYKRGRGNGFRAVACTIIVAGGKQWCANCKTPFLQ